jgi:aspartate ammonia-lyase
LEQGVTAPREYIFLVVERLLRDHGPGPVRAENLVDATQNADVFVEVSGILKPTR